MLIYLAWNLDESAAPLASLAARSSRAMVGQSAPYRQAQPAML
jgi:hypothetical protein